MHEVGQECQKTVVEGCADNSKHGNVGEMSVVLDIEGGVRRAGQTSVLPNTACS